jgi:hypothetical protein
LFKGYFGQDGIHSAKSWLIVDYNAVRSVIIEYCFSEVLLTFVFLPSSQWETTTSKKLVFVNQSELARTKDIRTNDNAAGKDLAGYAKGGRLQYADFQEVQEALSPDQAKCLVVEVM